MWHHIKKMKREHLIFIGVALVMFIFLIIIVLVGRRASPIVITDIQPATVVVPFTKLAQGRQSVVAKRVNYVLTSPAQLNELWTTIDAIGTPPKVDFKTHAVIAVFAGNESSSSIAIAKIEDTNARMVSIAIAKPDCTEPPAQASPYEIVAVSATSLPLAHTDIPTTSQCSR